MKITFTKAPTLTKAVVAAVVFTIVFLATNSNLPSCSDTVATLNAGACIERQSYLHTACGWLALASFITGVVLFILKRRNTSSAGQQALRPLWSEASLGSERVSQFCTQCGTSAVAGDSFCQHCGAPVETDRSPGQAGTATGSEPSRARRLGDTSR